MALNIPAGTPSIGTLSLTFVPETAITDPEAPTVAQVTGSSAVNVSCLIPSGTYTGVTTSVNRVKKRRACSAVPYFVKGETERNLESVQVIYNPQDLESEGSKGYVTLVPGTRWWMIDRRGKDGQAELAANDIVDLHLVEVIGHNKIHSDEDGEEAVVDILLAHQGTVHEDVSLAA